jgi:hypothetical protein
MDDGDRASGAYVMTAVETQTNIEVLVERAARRLTARDLWLNAKEAAAHAKLSLDNFLRRCRRGTGPACSGKGRLARFRLRDVDRWIASGFSVTDAGSDV